MTPRFVWVITTLLWLVALLLLIGLAAGRL